MSPALRLPLCLAFMALVSACVTFSGSAPAPLPEEARLHPRRFVIVTVTNSEGTAAFSPGSTPRGYSQTGGYWISSHAISAVRGLERDYGLREASAWPIETLHVQCVLFRLPQGTSRTSLRLALGRDRRVESVEDLNEFATESASTAVASASLGHASYLPLERNLRELGVIEAHRLSRGAGVRVAVVDTGIDFQHPDLRGRIVNRRDFVAGGERSFESDTHGTEVAGVIAAVAADGAGVLGVAPEARLIALKACWPLRAGRAHAVCDSFTLAQALEAALRARANIINLSLAGPPDPLLARLVQEGLRRGVIIVGAVAPGARKQFPTDIDGVLAVESGEDHRENRVGSLLAPGRDILTLMPGGHYDFASGSSLATAEVSGVVALLLTKRANLTPIGVREILVRSSRQMSTPRGLLTSVNACGALAIALQRSSCYLAGAKVIARKPLVGGKKLFQE
jgi:Subtilase family